MIATSEADTHDSTDTETDVPKGTTPLIDLRIDAASWGATPAIGEARRRGL